MSPPYLDFLDPACLPHGLPHQVYATWNRALRDLRDSQSLEHLEHAYQFCCGFAQALQDTQAVEPEVSLWLEARLREVWVERAAVFQTRG